MHTARHIIDKGSYHSRSIYFSQKKMICVVCIDLDIVLSTLPTLITKSRYIACDLPASMAKIAYRIRTRPDIAVLTWFRKACLMLEAVKAADMTIFPENGISWLNSCSIPMPTAWITMRDRICFQSCVPCFPISLVTSLFLWKSEINLMNVKLESYQMIKPQDIKVGVR